MNSTQLKNNLVHAIESTLMDVIAPKLITSLEQYQKGMITPAEAIEAIEKAQSVFNA